MSDIRLTSSKTKMKINLCIFLLCNTAVSVFGQSVELNGILGESVNFTAAVKIEGKLKYGTLTIGAVTSSRFSPPRNGGYSDRVQWDSSTGFFSLSGLRLEDSGAYTVENDDEPRSVSTFSLTVKAVSVFGQFVELNDILGKSVNFPAAVKNDGNLIYSGVRIGDVTGSRFTTSDKKYEDRVHWDSSTGFFSLSALKEEDSGVYTVQNTDQNINTVFQLNVYIPVSKPSVTFVSNEYPCTLQCTVERGTNGTLFWYRDSEKSPQGVSHFATAPHLNKIQAMLGGRTYTCEANNSVSNNKTSVYLEDHCRGGAAGIWQTEGSKMWSLCLVLIVMLCSRLV